MTGARLMSTGTCSTPPTTGIRPSPWSVDRLGSKTTDTGHPSASHHRRATPHAPEPARAPPPPSSIGGGATSSNAGGVRGEAPRSGAHLHRDPTINPGLGSPRCPRCLSLLNPTAGEGGWAITSVLHDATAVAGSGAGALLSAVHGFNTGIPFVQKHVKGPKWLQLLAGVPPLLLFSCASAVFGGLLNSYYAASSGSHYAVSQITRQIESAHFSESDEKSR
ncbi:hypothetical protein C2845_PM09G05680 [Panicum miliaceum]|uniref:Gb protein n=1 Tax=Panicum miliaceum TaxID=4540 RepID=A0A3L6S3X9_PANMI|nr:hypothetical protein C2845_PM09G05680 [Panicum miliaceum]